MQKLITNTTNSLVVYPNPATDMLQIATTTADDNVIFEISNTLGQVIHSGISNSIDVTTFDNGLYICNMVAKGKVIASAKFTIFH